MDTVVNISFTFGDIVNFFMYLLLAGTLVYLLLVLREFYIALKELRIFCDKNGEQIDTFVKEGSSLVKKVNTVAESIPDEPLSFLGDMTSSFPLVQNIISILIGMFGLNKKNK